MNWDSLRLSELTLPAKLLVTLFLLIVGPGYLFGTANIMFQHQDADLEPGLGVDDLRRTFHGMEKQVTPDADITVNSTMLEQVRPGGDMRKHLKKGGVPAAYWLDLRGYNPPKVARELEHPILVLQAERDYQVTMDCFEGWRKELADRQNVRMKVYPKLNHLFIEGQGRSTPSEYANAGNVAEEVVADIAAWIGEN